ncbi:hypothetical protein ABPG72_003453 [Tetrahymena utriculariae]
MNNELNDREIRKEILQRFPLLIYQGVFGILFYSYRQDHFCDDIQFLSSIQLTMHSCFVIVGITLLSLFKFVYSLPKFVSLSLCCLEILSHFFNVVCLILLWMNIGKSCGKLHTFALVYCMVPLILLGLLIICIIFYACYFVLIVYMKRQHSQNGQQRYNNLGQRDQSNNSYSIYQSNLI